MCVKTCSIKRTAGQIAANPRVVPQTADRAKILVAPAAAGQVVDLGAALVTGEVDLAVIPAQMTMVPMTMGLATMTRRMMTRAAIMADAFCKSVLAGGCGRRS